MVIGYSKWKSWLALGLGLFFGLPLNFVLLGFLAGWQELGFFGVLLILFIFGIPTLGANLVILASLQRLLFKTKAFEVTASHFILYTGLIRRRALAIPLSEIALVSLEQVSLGKDLLRYFRSRSVKTIRTVGKAAQFASKSTVSSDMVLSDTYLHLFILFYDPEKAVHYSRLYGYRLAALLEHARQTAILDIETGPIEPVTEKDLMAYIEQMKGKQP